MTALLIAFVAGVALYLLKSIFCWILALFAFGGSCYIYRHSKIKYLVLVLLGLSLGVARIGYQEHLLNAKSLNEFYNKKIKIVGRVIAIPTSQLNHLRFDFKTQTIEGKPCVVKLRLNWYGHRPYLVSGSRWQLQVKLHRLVVRHTKRSISYSNYFKTQAIVATGYVTRNTINQEIVRQTGTYNIDALRQRIALVVKHSVAGASLVGVLTALSVGSRHLLAKHEWKVFQATGTSHLIAVSGLHVGLVASLLFFIVGKLWKKSAFLCTRMASVRAATISAMLAAVLYAALAGFSIPTIRAVIMLIAVFGAALTYRNIPMWYRYLVAVVCVLVLHPFALLSVSFWLSFLATAILGFSLYGRLDPQTGVWQWFRIQILIFLGLIPVTLLFFQQLSVISLLTNLVAIPYVSFVVLPLCVLSLLGYFVIPVFDKWLWWVSAKALLPLWLGLKWCAKLPFALWSHSIDSTWAFLSLILAVALCLLPCPASVRILAVVFGLALFYA